MDVDESEICRLCLQQTNFFEPFWDLDRNMLEDILPGLNINPLANFYICKVCSEHLLQSYEFRRNFLATNSSINKSAKLTALPEQSPQVLVSECPSVKQEVVSQWCFLCNKSELCDVVISEDVLSEMLMNCFPELEGPHVFTVPVICQDCLQNLEIMSRLINVCLINEEKIKNYCVANGITDDWNINLNDVVAMEVDTKIVKEEMYISFDEDSKGSFSKLEPGEDDAVESKENYGSLIGNLNLDSSSLDFYEQALLLALICRRRRNKKRQRRFWVGPFAATRFKEGLFYNLYRELRKDDRKFSQHFGMSMKSFDELLSIIKASISGRNTMMRRCVPPDEKLALTLRYLVTGSSMVNLHREFRLGTSTISTIIQTVCKTLCGLLRSRCVPTLNESQWLTIAEKFEKNYNFPHCIGAVGAKNIKLINPKQNGFLTLLAVCDSEYRIIHFEVGKSNAYDWNDTTLAKKMASKSLNIPEATVIKGSDVVAPFVFLGDDTFSSCTYVMRPYSGRNLAPQRRIFNYRLSRARRQIDCTFAILSNKWKILQKRLDVSLDFAELIIKSCCVLHNYFLNREGYEYEHTLLIEGLGDINPYLRQGGRLATRVRDTFSCYFVSEAGQVPWQMSRIKNV